MPGYGERGFNGEESGCVKGVTPDKLPLLRPDCALALKIDEDVLARELAEPMPSSVFPDSRASESDEGRLIEASPPRKCTRDMFDVGCDQSAASHRLDGIAAGLQE